MNESKEKLDPDIMVISSLIDGKGYEAIKHTANRFNLLTPSKRTFYEHQKKVIKKVDEIVTKDCNHYTNNIKINSKLSCDCGWNHSPVGSAGTVTLYDHNQKKVIASKTLVKENGNIKAL